MNSKEVVATREEFTCDRADLVVPAIKRLDKENETLISKVEDNIVIVQAPLTLMDEVFLEVDRQLDERGEKKVPILL